MTTLLSNNSSITLYREVNKRVRYYSLKLYPTLFGEYLLIREYGGLKNKKPTRVIKEYYESVPEALMALKRLIKHKSDKGYTNYLS